MLRLLRRDYKREASRRLAEAALHPVKVTVFMFTPTKPIGELESRLTTMPGNTERVDMLNELAWQLKGSDATRASRYANEAGTLGAKLGYRSGVAYSLRVRISLCAARGEPDKAMNAARDALALYGSVGDKGGQSAVLDMMGTVRRKAGDYASALDCFNQSLALLRESDDTHGEAGLLKSIANIHVARSDYDQALEYYRQSLAVAQRVGDRRVESDVLNNIGAVYRRRGDHSTALEYLEKSLPIKQSLGDDHGRANTLNSIGLVYEGLGMYPKALECYNKSMPVLQKLGDHHGEAGVLSNIAVVYRHIGHFPKALEHFLNSLRIMRAIADKHGEAEILNNVGLLHLESGDCAAALDYLGDSLTIWRELGDRKSESVTLDSIGGAHYKLKKYDAALDCLKLSLTITQSSGDEHTMANTLCDIADVYLALGDFALAHENYRSSFELAGKINYKRRRAEALLGIGEVYLRQREWKKALESLGRALRTAEELGARELLHRSHYALSHACEGLGMFEQSLVHLHAHQRFKEEVFNEESDKTFKKLQAVHDVETAKHEAEIYRLKMVELAELNSRLNELVKEKSEILGIVAHDLKDPLGNVLVASRQVSEGGAHMPAGRTDQYMTMIRESAERMLDNVSKMLESEAAESDNLFICPSVVDLTALARSVVDDYRAKADEKAMVIQCEYAAPRVMVYADTRAVKQMLENLVSNAVKFAPHGTRVNVSVRQSDDTVQFAVRDEGPGLTEEDKEMLFRRFVKLSAQPTGGEHATGLGLSIVKKLAEKMNGRVWCESEPGKGATFTVELPCLARERE